MMTLAPTVVGCGSDDAQGPDRGGDDTGRGRDTGVSRDTGSRDAGTADATDDAGATDVGSDADPGFDAGDTNADATVDTTPDVIEPGCDIDGDGFASTSCGGVDCDDQNGAINPTSTEVCDFVDNNCSGAVNDGITCEVYAHSDTTLYLVDPFLGVYTRIGSVPTGLWDFDTSPDGTLYGIQGGDLYAFDGTSWSVVGALGVVSSANGFAIRTNELGFVTGGQQVFSVNLSTGVAELIGSTGYTSSGDCVINKDGTLLMSAAGFGSGPDELVILDAESGSGSPVGSIQVGDVYGLTAAWDQLFGFTGNGNVVLIDQGTGQGEVLHTFPEITFNGSASNPSR